MAAEGKVKQPEGYETEITPNDAEMVAEEILDAALHGNLTRSRFIYLFTDEQSLRLWIQKLSEAADDKKEKLTAEFVEYVRRQIRAFNARLLYHAEYIERSRAEEERKIREREQMWENLRRKFRKIFPWLAGSAALAGAIAGAVTIFEPQLARWKDERDLADFVEASMASRANARTPMHGKSLEGARIEFVCKTVPIDKRKDAPRVWQPISPSTTASFYDPDVLKEYFGAEVVPGEDLDITFAKAGWGTIVFFTREQIAAKLPEALHAIPIEIPGRGIAYIIPSAAFVPDEYGNRSGLFTTGEHAKDGRQQTFHVVGEDQQPICQGKVREAPDPGRKKLNGRLAAELPEINLENLIGEPLAPDPSYTEQLEKFDLDDWYEDQYYPALVKYADEAIRHASRNGVPREELQPLADFLKLRRFEDYLLKMLNVMRENSDGELTKRLCEQIEHSRVPYLNLTDKRFFGMLDKRIATIHKSGGKMTPKSTIFLHSGRYTSPSIFSALVFSLFRYNPSTAWFGGPKIHGNQGDLAFQIATMKWLSQVATGGIKSNEMPGDAALDRDELRTIYPFVKRGHLRNLLDHLAFHPKKSLTKEQRQLFEKLGQTPPAGPLGEHLAAAILELSGIADFSPGLEDDKTRNLQRAFALIDEFEQKPLGENEQRDASLYAQLAKVLEALAQ